MRARERERERERESKGTGGNSCAHSPGERKRASRMFLNVSVEYLFEFGEFLLLRGTIDRDMNSVGRPCGGT